MTYQPPELLVVQAIRAMDPELLALIADSNPTYGSLVFRDALPLKLTPTGLRAVTVASRPGGTAPQLTQVYASMVTCSIYCDHTRDINGNASIEDGIDRAWAAFGNLDYALNRAELLLTDPAVQSNRMTTPLESWDQDQNLPYLAVNYDVSIVSTR